MRRDLEGLATGPMTAQVKHQQDGQEGITYFSISDAGTWVFASSNGGEFASSQLVDGDLRISSPFQDCYLEVDSNQVQESQRLPLPHLMIEAALEREVVSYDSVQGIYGLSRDRSAREPEVTVRYIEERISEVVLISTDGQAQETLDLQGDLAGEQLLDRATSLPQCDEDQ